MDHFGILDGEQAIIHSKGFYFQVDLYLRRNTEDTMYHVYFKKGGGFVRLLKGGATGRPEIKWVQVSHTATPVFDMMGYMVR